VFCDNGRVADEDERWGIKIGMIWRIRADIRNQWYNMPD
jgi:hypothetical protein